MILVSFNVLLLYFSLCAFFGWIIESSFRTINKKRRVNSGFLNGPFIPIYGFAGIIIYILDIYTQNLLLPVRFILFFIIPTALEYFTSYYFEKILNFRLWDYSDQKFNYQGRVCLKFSLIWFVLVLFGVFIIQPFFNDQISKTHNSIIQTASSLLIVYFSIDLFVSVMPIKRKL